MAGERYDRQRPPIVPHGYAQNVPLSSLPKPLVILNRVWCPNKNNFPVNYTQVEPEIGYVETFKDVYEVLQVPDAARTCLILCDDRVWLSYAPVLPIPFEDQQEAFYEGINAATECPIRREKPPGIWPCNDRLFDCFESGQVYYRVEGNWSNVTIMFFD